MDSFPKQNMLKTINEFRRAKEREGRKASNLEASVTTKTQSEIYKIFTRSGTEKLEISV